MKNILIPVLAMVTLLTSCAPTQEDLVVQKVQESMKDPSSFELVSVTHDSVFVSQHLQELIDYCGQKCSQHIDKANEELEWAKSFSSSRMIQRYLDKSKIESQMANSWLTKQKEFKDKLVEVNNTPQDTLMKLNYTVKCYGNNSYGARVINDIKVSVKPNGEMTLN